MYSTTGSFQPEWPNGSVFESRMHSLLITRSPLTAVQTSIALRLQHMQLKQQKPTK
jgi:hypothetical protein